MRKIIVTVATIMMGTHSAAFVQPSFPNDDPKPKLVPAQWGSPYYGYRPGYHHGGGRVPYQGPYHGYGYYGGPRGHDYPRFRDYDDGRRGYDGNYGGYSGGFYGPRGY